MHEGRHHLAMVDVLAGFDHWNGDRRPLVGVRDGVGGRIKRVPCGSRRFGGDLFAFHSESWNGQRHRNQNRGQHGRRPLSHSHPWLLVLRTRGGRWSRKGKKTASARPSPTQLWPTLHRRGLATS